MWGAFGTGQTLGMPWVPVCNRGQSCYLFVFFPFLFFSVSFYLRTIKTSQRDLFDSTMNYPSNECNSSECLIVQWSYQI